MNTIDKFHLLIIDDNPVIHTDMRKVLQKPKNNLSTANTLEQSIFAKETANSGALTFEFDSPETTLLTNPEITNELPEFIIDSASQGEEGFKLVLESLKEHHPYAVAIIDVRMPPGWDGLETIQRIWEIDPDMHVIICTAFSDYTWTEMVKHLGHTDRFLVLKKPFDNIELRQMVCALSKKWMLTKHLYANSNLNVDTEDKAEELIAILNAIPDGLLTVSNKGEITHYNDNFLSIWQLAKADITGKKFTTILDKIVEQINFAEDYLNQVSRLQNDFENPSFIELYAKDGRVIDCYSHPHRVGNKYRGRVWSYREVSKKTDKK